VTVSGKMKVGEWSIGRNLQLGFHHFGAVSAKECGIAF